MTVLFLTFNCGSTECIAKYAKNTLQTTKSEHYLLWT